MNAIIGIKMSIILNITDGTFFIYKDGEFANLLEPLFEKQKDGISRWCKTDKIVFVPEHLKEHVLSTCDRVYPPIHRVRT